MVQLTLEMLRAVPPPDLRFRIADIGTGSGAILLALLSELPDAFGIATDVSVAALRTASANAVNLGLARRAAFVACDYAAALSNPFDLIVSNPPYIRSTGSRTRLRGPRYDFIARWTAARTDLTPTVCSFRRPRGCLRTAAYLSWKWGSGKVGTLKN